MLDLRTDAVTEWLQLARPADDPNWPPPIRGIEATPRAEILLIELGALLERQSHEDAPSLSAKLQRRDLTPSLQILFAQLGVARPLRVLHWLNERGIPNNFAIIAALLAGDTPSARALNAAVAAVSRRATLTRLFAPERLTELQTAAETALKEPA